MNKLLLATLATAFTANVAIAESVVEVNGVLADTAGRTLYTFDKDADNKSNCNGGCAPAWAPYLLEKGDPKPPNIRVVGRGDKTPPRAPNRKTPYYFAAHAPAAHAESN